MPLIITRNDIIKMQVDAIVNPTNPTLYGVGGVDGAIQQAAGPKLYKKCRTLANCNVGNAIVTKGYDLPCKYIIHTVGPVWQGGNFNEENLLRKCYENSLDLALRKNVKSIAFPLIATGTYKFPKEKALKISKEILENFLINHEMTIYLVVFDNTSFKISSKLFNDVSEFINDNYVNDSPMYYNSTIAHTQVLQDISQLPFEDDLIIEEKKRTFDDETIVINSDVDSTIHPSLAPPTKRQLHETTVSKRSLEDIVSMVDDNFPQRLFKLIDLKNKTDVEVYKKANIDRKLFSKIKSNKNYRPSKQTIIAFCFALELNIDETRDLLLTGGFALSRSSKFDIIIEYFITNNIYNIYEVNETLFAFEQNLLGV